MSASPPKAVFLSYASQDAERALRICEALRASGVEVWFDQSELRGGDVWDQKIKRQIRECALFLPVISANTNARAEGYFRLEWKLAVERSRLMADDALFLVPAVIDEMTDAEARVPDKFREVQWTRLRGTEAPANFAARVAALLNGPMEPARPAPRDEPTKPATAETKTRRSANIEPAPSMDWRPAPDVAVPGTKWTLERKLGEGGFGEVWLGRHQTMKERRVFKFCFEAERVRSLKRELTLFRVLKERVGGHPNIVRLLDVHFDEPPFYVEMDYVEGQSLKVWCEQQGGVGQIPLAARLEIVAQIADALHAAHTAGVIHRDVKPGNILVSPAATPGAQPVAKLSDFGIGQVLSDEALSGMTKSGFTQSIVVDSSSARSGTQLYMAPELAAGVPASVRSDLYSLGVVLFQLVVGDMHRPLTTDWTQSVDDPMLREDLTRCFASRAEERFASADLLAQSLRAFVPRRAAYAKEQAAAAERRRAVQRWKILRTTAVAVVVVGLSASLIWFLQRNSKLRWARQQALPAINRLVEAGDISAAFALAREAEKYLPDDPALTGLWPRIAAKTTIQTTPAGADVYVKDYQKPDSEWKLLGKSPLKDIRLARAYSRWQIRKEGYETLEQAAAVGPTMQFPLDKVGAIPPGMVRVRGSTTNATFTGLPSVQLDDYAIDRHEVTNRQFKEFVGRGGYTKGDYWKQPMGRQGKPLAWAEAVAGFRDTTGQPGPATWRSGNYPDGEADHPVTGISWFEAAAYAEFAGKRLPSIYHWRLAALVAAVQSIVPLSNFAGKGLARVGSYQGMSACGAFDLAGNAKEWCWNEAGPDTRYILGGGWREPDYMFSQIDALSPFDRSPLNGFRCIKLLAAAALPEAIDAVLVPVERNYANEKPVGDEAFRLFRSFYRYDKTPLEPKVEATDDSDLRWRKEKISFNAAYDHERMAAYVFLPKEAVPPYQVVVYFPGSGARNQATSERLDGGAIMNVVVASGRAFVYPVYKSTYERGGGAGLNAVLVGETSAYRDLVVHVAKDLCRTIDYLETRPDIRADKVGYLGNSWGGALGSLLPALDSRIKANVLMIGGLFERAVLPEADQINFAPRVTMPTLMLNGRHDFRFPLETSQRPMFRFLGAPEEHKRHLLFESGHALTPTQVTKPILDWLDKYLGPVK